MEALSGLSEVADADSCGGTGAVERRLMAGRFK